MNLELVVEERGGNINLGVISIKMILKMMSLDEIIQGENVRVRRGDEHILEGTNIDRPNSNL